MILLEGVEAAVLPCTLTLLLPGLAIAVASGRNAPWATVGMILGTSLGAWLRFAGWWFDEPEGGGRVVVAAALVALGVILVAVDRAWSTVLAAFAVGGIASWLWVPCVGPGLGDIINNTSSDPARYLVPLLFYFVGVFLPLIILSALAYLHPALARVRDHRITRGFGFGLICLIAAALAFGFYDEIRAELSRITGDWT